MLAQEQRMSCRRRPRSRERMAACEISGHHGGNVVRARAPEVTPASCVLAPTSFMTALREKEPVVV